MTAHCAVTLCQLMQKSKHAISIIIFNYLSEISWENKKSTGYLNNKQSKSKQKVTQIEPQTVKLIKRTVSPALTEVMLNPSEILNLFQTWQLSMWKWSIHTFEKFPLVLRTILSTWKLTCWAHVTLKHKWIQKCTKHNIQISYFVCTGRRSSSWNSETLHPW